MSTIIRFVINDPVTLIVANLFAVQGAALCLKVLDFLHTGAPQIAAGEAAGTISIQLAAPDPKTKCNLQSVLLCQKSELQLADGPQLGTSANQRQFLGELLRDCGFFAHLVLRQVRAVDNPSNRVVDRNSGCKKSNVVKVSQTLPRSASSTLPRRLRGEAPGPQGEAPLSLQTLWVEVGCRHVKILVSDKGAS